MKSRKQKSGKAVSSKRKAPCDVSPSTSLPPLVEGQLRCFLQVTISRVLWTVHKPPPATFVRLRWWGESSNGTHFCPPDASQVSQTIKTTARFPIRCGPRQFTSYLTDMSVLVLDVLTKLDHLPIGRAQVAGISRLSLSHPISGFYTLVSPTSEKLGELQVSLTLEPLTEAYDSSSSVPASDISIEVPRVTTLTVPSQPRRLSVGNRKDSGGSSGNTPRGKDHLYFQSAQMDKGNEESLENQMPTDRSQYSQTAVNPPRQEPSDGQTTNDLLSVILERGTKLRNAMVVSALKCDLDSALALKDTPLPLPKDNILPAFKRSALPCGTLLQNILHADSSLQHSHHTAGVSDCMRPDRPLHLDMENRAVELILGRLNTSPLPLWDGEGSPPESLSLHSVFGDSDSDDPQYDHSLLENLFYKTPMTNVRPDDTAMEVEKAISSSNSQKKSCQGGAEKQSRLPQLLARDSKSKHQRTTPSQIISSPQRQPSSRSQHADTGREELPADSAVHKPCQQVEEVLHALLMVPDGKDFNCGPMQAPNIYLNCKLFWRGDTVRSDISWRQANPTFNFSQVIPVALTTKLLERMENSIIVIEVWQRTVNSREDEDPLIGLVKLPLHQFYLSFRDSTLTHLLLQAQYPVLGVDRYMPVIDILGTGTCKGYLKVLLAMGHPEQIVALRHMRDEECGSAIHLLRPLHPLDHQPHSPTKVSAMREHLFVIRVEKVNGLMPLQSTVWGEADCYIQYNFPSQEEHSAADLDTNLIESTVNLKQFRTTTTLCVPDPMFGHSETHVLLSPEGVPVQRLLLSSLSSRGLASGGGVQFEVWCRYYYPNVRDQLVAKGMLPLSKLCAMVTMQRQQPNEAHHFSLPLLPKTDGPTAYQPQPSGLLDVCILYKHRPMRAEGQMGRGVTARVVTLVLQLQRASGLQAAARLLSEQDERFKYYAEVGVNAYVTVQLSFLPEAERRCTRIAARTFCPEFDHYMEVPCELQVQRSSGERCSLAEQLEEASAVFTVWNRDSRKVVDTPKSKDTMLGTVKIPLADLIHKRTGISGWYGVCVPQDLSLSPDHHSLVGGLEISINFAHHADRERVIKAAQGLGWEMAQKDYEQQDDEEAWEDGTRTVSLTFSMPRAWIPVHCLLLPGHSELQRSTYCYFRYKFYDQDAFCSQMKHPSAEEGGEKGQATVAFQSTRTVTLRSSQPLIWYLRQEKLEIQLWVAFRKDKTQRPHDTDRLVGSAFVDLSSLTKRSEDKLTISGVYALFRHSATDLHGAALRVHISLCTGCLPGGPSAGADSHVDSQEMLLSGEEEAGEKESGEEEAVDRSPSPTTTSKQPSTQSRHENMSSTGPDLADLQRTEMSTEESFPVNVTVERAMHVSLKGCPLAERNATLPCCCVLYITADSAEAVSTAVVDNTDCPVWDHHHECRLSNQLLLDPQQSFVFKVWHKGDMERVIGFASVDLFPLLSGFQSVCGWYNITDFSGQCQGQLKVSITPLKGVHDLRGLRNVGNQEASKNSPAQPLNYHTSATYSSFPSHISCFLEQKITSPHQAEGLFPERSSESDRHCEHMDNVHLYHRTLQEQAAGHSVCSSSAADIHPSSSVLFSALRKNLSELDNIQRYFSHKLSTPTFPSTSCYAKPVEHQDWEKDTCHLLLESHHLVGEVNNLMSGLDGHTLEMMSQSRSLTPPNGDDNPLLINFTTFPETVSSPQRASDSPLENVSPLPSPLPSMSEDSQAEEEEYHHQHRAAAVSEDEEGEGTACRKEEEADDEEEDDDEDGDEVVVKPRHLNEVTSLTDKTSPWTSVLSDPELDSQDNLEVPEEPHALANRCPELPPEEAEGNRRLGAHTSLQDQSPRGEHRYTSLEESELFDSHLSNGSVGGILDTERDCEQREQAVDDGLADEGPAPKDSTAQALDDGPAHSKNDSLILSPNPQTRVAETSCSLPRQDTQSQRLVPLEVANFFLPRHKLEASMRVLRLAPAFHPPNPESRSSMHSIPPPRPPLRRLDRSAMKKNKDRIALIFHDGDH